MRYLLLIPLLVISCNNEPSYESREEIFETSSDSLQKMMEFISFVDSSGLVEQVSNDFVELKETNEKLETTLEETQQELYETKEELVETKVTLQKAEKIVKAITGDSVNGSTGFELLPIKK